MLTPDFPAPWHKASFERFYSERLPQLLAERLPLAGYSAQPTGDHTRQVAVEIAGSPHPLTVTYPGLPDMDAQGLFYLDGAAHIVVPVASREELDLAEIKCAGELLYDFIAARLGELPAGLAWEESLARAILPLEAWISEWLRAAAQRLDTTNWHSRQTHLRRVLIPNRTRVIAPGQMGRVDPFETPEGSYIGRVFTVALGAEIRAEKIVILDDSYAAGLGPNAACIPFIEYDDANRLLMGDNMMRQALVPETPEPAWVQTGREPGEAGPDLWCGRNLLTAFLAWGEGSIEDGLVISESCARRLNYPYPAEPGDKLSYRHGIKGVVSQVLPDAQMPHLADGTPVEICHSFSGIPTRHSFGEVMEALLGRAARAEGRPAVVPSYAAPSPEEIRARLASAGLPADGMEVLRAGKDGPPLELPSTVGYVYWYRLAHLARPKIQVAGPQGPAEQAQPAGEFEFGWLRKVGALTLAGEMLRGQSLDADPSAAASAYFARLAQRLASAGIAASRESGRLSFGFADPQPGALALAQAFPHPWLREQALDRVGPPPAFAGEDARRAFSALEEANQNLARRLASRLPERLVEDARARVATALAAYLDALLPPAALRVNEPQRLSGRAVTSPGVGLHLDQVGLPAEMAEGLFGAEARSRGITLAEAMRDAWVILVREPAVLATSLVAFRPFPTSAPAILLPPQACDLLNTDFDGDQLMVFLPASPRARAEAGELLSVAGHIRRDPALLDQLLSPHEGLWGLAWLSLTAGGQAQIAAILGCSPGLFSSPLNRAELAGALRALADRDGIPAAVQASEELVRLGCRVTAASGASIHPFARSQNPLPPQPASADSAEWAAYLETCAETILSGRDYRNPNLGPQLLSTLIRPRTRRALPFLVGPHGPGSDETGRVIVGRRSIAEGRAPAELLASVSGARQGLARLGFDIEAILNQVPTPASPFMKVPGDNSQPAYTVLARARRSPRPGIVFAAAARYGESDPVRDEETRLLVG